MDSNMRRWTGLGATVVVAIALGAWGIQAHRRAQAQQAQIQRIGAEWQQEGMLSQQEYVTLLRIAGRVVQTRAVSDQELDWLLATMAHSPSTIVRARVLTILSTLSNPPASQKARIKAGIAPMLQDGNQLDELSAQRVQQKLSMSARAARYG